MSGKQYIIPSGQGMRVPGGQSAGIINRVVVDILEGNVSAGSPQSVVDDSLLTSLTKMDDTHMILCYADRDSSSHGTAVCLTLSGDTVSVGTPVVFAADTTSHLDVVSLDSTHAIVSYDAPTTNDHEAVCLSLSGTTITVNTPVTIDSTPTTGVQNAVALAAMDSTHAIAFYRRGSDAHCIAACLTLSGTTISVGTAETVSTEQVSSIQAGSFDSTYALVTYGYSTANEVCAVSLSGATVTAGTPVSYDTSGGELAPVEGMDSTHAIILYRDQDQSNRGEAVCVTRSGTTLTVNTPAVFETGSSTVLAIDSRDDTYAVISYKDNGDSGVGKSLILTLDGTTLTAGTPATHDNSNNGTNVLAVMSGSKAVVVFSGWDDVANYPVEASVLTLS